ncbi:MAG TPA: hypothetical protein VJI66_01085, partial [Candidatus Paceibacterota bacterium]
TVGSFCIMNACRRRSGISVRRSFLLNSWIMFIGRNPTFDTRSEVNAKRFCSSSPTTKVAFFIRMPFNFIKLTCDWTVDVLVNKGLDYRIKGWHIS